MLEYMYDDQGLVEAIEFDGQRYELSDAEKETIPGKRLPKTKSIQANLTSTVEDLKDSYEMTDADPEDSIIVDVEATHGGYYNKNMYNYLVSGMEEMVGTWTRHGAAPYLVNHNMTATPRGRVQDAQFVSTGSDTGYHALDVRVGDPQEIEMIIDGRALHVSVGSRPVDTVECRICGHDIYHDGNTPIRYELDGKPSRSVMQKKAPGYFGSMLGMENEDYWSVEEDEDGNYSALCRHVRGFDAPMGGDEELTTGWLLYGQNYKELSRVNLPADRNDATGEFAHIREVIDDSEEMTDAAMDRLITDALSRVDRGAVQHARVNIARDSDLWVPSTPEKAASWAEDQGFDDCFFDTGLWLSVNSQHGSKTMQDQVRMYYDAGGRFIDTDQAFDDPSTEEVDAAEALQFEDASDWGQWLRNQDLSREDKRMLDRMYTKRYLRRS